MQEAPIAQGPVDVDVRQGVTDQIAGAMAAKTDNILREAVTLFLGHGDWTLGELKGRCELHRLPGGVEVFVLDGVAIVELLPIRVEHKQKGASLLNATRQHRFLLPNAQAQARSETESPGATG